MSNTTRTRGLAVFMRPTSYPMPRITRNMLVAQELGYDTIFIGAARERELVHRTEQWEGLTIQRVGPHYPEGVRGYVTGTPLWMFAAFRALRRLRPALIHASDIEAMLGVALYRASGRHAFTIYNIHDNLSLRHPWPSWVATALNRVEAFAGRRADSVMVPDETRLELLAPWKPRRGLVIPNTLDDPGYQPLRPNGVLRVFCGGWLNWRRGFQVLGDVVNSRSDVHLVTCGLGGTDIVAFLRSLPRTEFLGYVPQQAALDAAARCDVVFAFYDPSVEINRFASPNKIFDAMALGRPVIANQELHIADWIRREGAGFCIPYGDATALSALVDRLLADPERLVEVGRRARELYESKYRWDQVKGLVREEFERASNRITRRD